MLSNILSIIITFVGLTAILLVYIINFRNNELTAQLTRATDRIDNLREQIQQFRSQATRQTYELRREIALLKGEDPPMAEPTPPNMDEPLEIEEISAADLKSRLDNGDDVFVVDMRQPFEYQAGHIPTAVNIFLQEIPARVDEIPKDKDVVFQCWHGNSSLQASAYLIENGWSASRVRSLEGGIAGWTEEHGVGGLVRA